MTATQTFRQARRLARRVRTSALTRLPDPLRSPIEDALTKRRVRAGYEAPLVPESELRTSYRKALALLAEAGTPMGDYLEFGVCHGTSMRCMHHAVTEADADDARLFGFDSFEGLPPEAADDDDGAWVPGQFESDEDYTRQLLTDAGIDWSRTHLVKGWYKDSLTDELVAEHEMAGRTTVVMVDCDMYLSAKESLDFCATALADHAIIFFDDWNSGGGLAERNLGEKRAFDEFLAEHPEFSAEEVPELRYGVNTTAFAVRRS